MYAASGVLAVVAVVVGGGVCFWRVSIGDVTLPEGSMTLRQGRWLREEGALVFPAALLAPPPPFFSLHPCRVTSSSL